MKIRADKKIGYDLFKQEIRITVTPEQANQLFKIADGKNKYTVEIKKETKARSLNANSYLWVLVGKIADVLRTDKDAVYKELIRRYGQFNFVVITGEMDFGNYFNDYEILSNHKHEYHLKIYRGSSTYDSREMAILIDGAVSEAKDLEIETLPEDEIKSLLEQEK